MVVSRGDRRIFFLIQKKSDFLLFPSKSTMPSTCLFFSQGLDLWNSETAPSKAFCMQ